MPEYLERLRECRLGVKHGLALREFALGVEALDHFLQGEPFPSVHECVLAVPTLESEQNEFNS
jgi:protein phosphatase